MEACQIYASIIQRSKEAIHTGWNTTEQKQSNPKCMGAMVNGHFQAVG